MIINLVVGVNIPIVRIPMKGGMTVPNAWSFDPGTYRMELIFKVSHEVRWLQVQLVFECKISNGTATSWCSNKFHTVLAFWSSWNPTSLQDKQVKYLAESVFFSKASRWAELVSKKGGVSCLFYLKSHQIPKISPLQYGLGCFFSKWGISSFPAEDGWFFLVGSSTGKTPPMTRCEWAKDVLSFS